MNLIHKYPVRHDRICPISKAAIVMPKNARILKVAMHSDFICFWSLFERFTEETEVRYFYVIGTNQIIPEGASYLDTVFDGDYVWHIFEEKLL